MLALSEPMEVRGFVLKGLVMLLLGACVSETESVGERGLGLADGVGHLVPVMKARFGDKAAVKGRAPN